MTFEDIQRVNATIRTTDIKGKEYAEVNQRIKAFRQLYPEGFIRTEIENLEDGFCVIKATVGYTITGVTESGYPVSEGVILATGTAYEKEQSSYINKTSYIENCETSAVGRALGMLGLGIDTSIASAEEVTNAIHQQEQMSDGGKKATKQKAEQAMADDPLITHDKVEVAVAVIRGKQTTLANVLSAYGVEALKDMRESQYADMMKRLDKTPNK